MQMCKSANVQQLKCATVPMCKCANVQQCQCAIVPMCKCASMQICKFENVHVCKCTDLQVCQPVKSLNVCQFFSVSTRLMAIGLVFLTRSQRAHLHLTSFSSSIILPPLPPSPPLPPPQPHNSSSHALSRPSLSVLLFRLSTRSPVSSGFFLFF